jgi:hypothetical protein
VSITARCSKRRTKRHRRRSRTRVPPKVSAPLASLFQCPQRRVSCCRDHPWGPHHGWPRHILRGHVRQGDRPGPKEDQTEAGGASAAGRAGAATARRATTATCAGQAKPAPPSWHADGPATGRGTILSARARPVPSSSGRRVSEPAPRAPQTQQPRATACALALGAIGVACTTTSCTA